MLYVENANNIDPTEKLSDLKVIRDIASRCGMKSKIIANPTLDIEDDFSKVFYNTFS